MDPGDDYRYYKQPVDLKSGDELAKLTDLEKEMFAEKVKTEIFENKHREAVYIAKRKELLEIENAYRLLSTKNRNPKKLVESKIKTQDCVIEGLGDQIQDLKRKHKQMVGAQNDMDDKIGGMGDIIDAKSNEVKDIGNIIDLHAKETDLKEKSIFEKKLKQQVLLQQFEGEKENLFNARDAKSDAEERIAETQRILLAKKQQQFEINQRMKELYALAESQRKETRDLEQENVRTENEIERRTKDL